MTENLNPETIEAVASPSKFAILKSKITREGLILGGIAAGAIIAGAHVLLKSQATPEIEDLTATERTTFVQTEILAETGNL